MIRCSWILPSLMVVSIGAAVMLCRPPVGMAGELPFNGPEGVPYTPALNKEQRPILLNLDLSDQTTGDAIAVANKSNKCRTMQQTVTLADGTNKQEAVTVCKGVNGQWEVQSVEKGATQDNNTSIKTSDQRASSSRATAERRHTQAWELGTHEVDGMVYCYVVNRSIPGENKKRYAVLIQKPRIFLDEVYMMIVHPSFQGYDLSNLYISGYGPEYNSMNFAGMPSTPQENGVNFRITIWGIGSRGRGISEVVRRADGLVLEGRGNLKQEVLFNTHIAIPEMSELFKQLDKCARAF